MNQFVISSYYMNFQIEGGKNKVISWFKKKHMMATNAIQITNNLCLIYRLIKAPYYFTHTVLSNTTTKLINYLSRNLL